MLSGYAKNETFCDAVDVFEAMPVKNVASHNAMLSLYLGIGDFMSVRIRRLESVWDDEEQFDDVARCRSKLSKSCDLFRVLLDFAITSMFLVRHGGDLDCTRKKMSLQVERKLMLEYDTKKGKNSLLKAGYVGWLLYTAASTGDLASGIHSSSLASDKCQKEKRKTINGDDLIWALTTLGFEDYIEPLKVHLTRYREEIAVSPH
ncbi:Nuclear transcription factor Y subunit B [Capsicum chinense]|nr:Nuclear transcription factor Y subunit B [Capsicum chinense]